MSYLSPVPLTIMRHPSSDLVQEVTAWVAKQVAEPTRRRLQREVTGSLIIRESSGPPPA